MRPASLVWLYRADEAGVSVRVGEVTLPARIQYAWPSEGGSRLYVASSDSAGRGSPGAAHQLTVCRVDRQSGSVVVEHDPISLPSRPIHLSLDHESAHVLVAFNESSRGAGVPHRRER